MNTRCVALLLLSLCVSGGPAWAEELAAPPKMTEIAADMRADIVQLLTTLQSDASVNQAVDQLFTGLKMLGPKVPDKVWEKTRAKVDAASLRELAIPFYAQYYTHDDIQQLLAFVQSPVGQKFLVTEPKIFQATFAAGREWGRRIAEQVRKDLKAEGYELAM
jgi:hypothetical protein